MVKTHIIIVAAGSGSRFGGPMPKQFCALEGRPVVMRAIDAMRRLLPDADITLVLNPDDLERWTFLCNQHQMASPQIAFGGSTRWESVKNGLATVADDASLVMVHDGARPFPTEEIIAPLISVMADDDVHGAVPAVPVTDTLRSVAGTVWSHPLDRSTVRAVQTPQIFRTELLRTAYKQPFESTMTDDASVMERAGYDHIAITPGSPLNIKITNPLDIAIAETILLSGDV